MNKKVKIFLAVGLLAVTTLHAASGDPGTSSDPLVTKSYVDKKIASITSGSSGASSDVAVTLKAQEQLINQLINQVNELKQQGSSTYNVVTVPAGKMILGKQGTEMILRAGDATVLSTQAGGLQDMTAGTDINGGALAPKYHLLIVPKEDGRGLMANKPLTLMVRGGYMLQ